MSTVLQTAIALLRMVQKKIPKEPHGWWTQLALARELIEEDLKQLWAPDIDAPYLRISSLEFHILLIATSEYLRSNSKSDNSGTVVSAIANLFDANSLEPVFLCATDLDLSKIGCKTVFPSDPRLVFCSCDESLGRQVRRIMPRSHCVVNSESELRNWRQSRKATNSWLTIVIPTMGEPWLEESIDSLLEQTEKKFSAIIISGETDGRAKFVLNKLNLDERFLLIESIDDGPYDAMNLANLISGDDWVYTLGCDDKLSSPSVLKQIKKVISRSRGSNIVYGNVLMKGDAPGSYDGQIYNWAFSYDQLLTHNPCHQAIFYRRREVLARGGYNVKYRICSDWDLNVRLWQTAKPVFSDVVVAEFRRGGLSTEVKDHIFFKDLPNIWRQNA